MEISDHTDAVLSDDYEEGEILDEDTLYDNVSSLEEFSGSETELNSIGEIASVVVKQTSSDGRKGKHHKRKEHKCKEESICRKERSGKHCYARIRKGKATIEITDKAKNVEVVSTSSHDPNQRRKSHVFSAVHGHTMKNDPRRLPIQKDLLEKENRCSHRYPRYYDYHKSVSHRNDKKKLCEKQIKKHFDIESRCRSYESRKRSKSPSPKLSIRNKVAPRGGSSLLKRLVGSGSIGVKTPKEVEESKKAEVISLVEKDIVDLTKYEEVVNTSVDSIEEGEIDDVSVKEPSTTFVNLEVSDVKEPIINRKEEYDTTNKSTEEDCKQIEEKQVQEGLNTNFKKSIKEPVIEAAKSVAINDGVKSPKEDKRPETVEVNKEISEPLDLENNMRSPVNESANDMIDCESIHYDANQKNEQEIPEDIDELNLRLEALRTAMLKKHKERKKRGFICKKKSTLEDDSFAEYVLSNVEQDNSTPTQEEVGHSDCNGVNDLGNLLNPEDMVIDKSDDDDERNILESFSYPSSYPVENSASIPLHYRGYAGVYSMFAYPELNGSVPYTHLINRDLGTAANGSIIQDLTGYVYPNNQLLCPLQAETPQISLKEDKESFSRADFQGNFENQPINTHSLNHCLTEINSNKEVLIERIKRVRRPSAKLKLCRRKELDGKKWHLGRTAMKRKLMKREYSQQKRRRRESLRDLKIIRTKTEEEINDAREESDEESTLRELALKSVKEKPKNFVDSEDLHKENNNVTTRETSVKIGEGEIFQQLQIEIDNNISVKPLISCDSESTPTNLSSSETWDDIDEDILRAQLLSSLSSRIPTKNEDDPNTVLSRFTKKQVKALRRAERKSFELQVDRKLKLNSQKVNKENFKKNSKIKALEIAKRKSGFLRIVNHLKQKPQTSSIFLGQNTADVPLVPKLIISLNEDSSSEDEVQQSSNEINKTDVVRSIDLFLQEARIENDLKQGQQTEKDSSKSCEINSAEEKKLITVKGVNGSNKANITEAGHGTPQFLKHLPAWQQEEYRRLKKQIAEKEKILRAKEKVQIPFESEVINESALSKSTNINNNLSIEEYELCQKSVEEITPYSAGETDNECLSNINDNSDFKNNDINSGVQTTKEIKTEKSDQQNIYSKSLSCSVKNFDRSRIVEEVNQMAKIVAHLEREMGSYRNLHKVIAIKKKELLFAKLNMTKKKKVLFEIKKMLISKEKFLQAKIDESSLPKVEQNDTKKQANRDLELCKLRMREFNLRTKMIFDEIDHTGLNKVDKLSLKRILPLDKSKVMVKTNMERGQPECNRISNIANLLPKIDSINKSKTISENNSQSNGSSNLSEKQSESWDPFVPICPFDLSGVCKDEECKFQHLKAV